MVKILNTGTFHEAEARLSAAFRILLGINSEQPLENKDVLAAVEVVERRTAKKKATSILKFKNVSLNSLFV